MKHTIIFFVCLIFVVSVGFGTQPKPVTATGNTYYVSTTGSDATGNGSLATPWATPQKAARTMVAGDTCNIEAGTYTYSGSTAQLEITISGTSGNPITYQNYNGGIVVFQPGANSAGILIYDANYINIIGIQVTGANDTGIAIEKSCSHILLQNCYTSGSANAGILVWDSAPTLQSYITINGCTVTGTNSNSNSECISLTHTSNFTVENCNVSDAISTQRCGIDTKVGCSNGSIYNNTITNIPQGTGIYIDAGGLAESNISVYDNLIYNLGATATAGIVLADESGTTSLSSISIYNNIIYNNSTGFVVNQYGTSTYNFSFINNTLYNNDGDTYEIEIGPTHTYLSNCIIRNNIFYATVSRIAGIIYRDYANGNVTIDHNLFYNSGGSWSSSNILGTSYVTGNPLFVNTGTNFVLQDGSTAIGTGSSTGAPTTDYTGQTRASPPCIGAYEYLTGVSLTITSTSLPTGNVNSSYLQTLAATGGTPPYNWSTTSGSLPTGLSISSVGVISGTPWMAGGPTSVTFKVTDSTGATATKSLSIMINITISITTSSLPNGTLGVAYSQTLTETGGTAPLTWTVVSGTLPAGLSLSPSGVISGIPTMVNNPTSVTFRVTDYTSATSIKALSITINGKLTNWHWHR